MFVIMILDNSNVSSFHFKRPPYAGSQPQTPSTPPKKGESEDDMWRQKRQEKNQEMSTAIERARQRRDEEEKRMETERRKGAEEKLKALEERAKRKNDSSKVNCLKGQPPWPNG